jgi:SAM-dependent methyltransferase
VALGLLPWLHDPARAVRELARVLRPGGWLIATADNRVRLNFLTEPRESPLLAPLKVARRAGRRALGRVPRGAQSTLHRPLVVDELLASVDLKPARRATIGFGPFTFLGRSLVADAAARRLDDRLRELSRERLPVLRRTGWHYLVAAQKVAP